MQYKDNDGINVCITILTPGEQVAFTVPLNTEQYTNIAKITILDKDGKVLDASTLSTNRINQKAEFVLSKPDRGPCIK